ncbi:leucine zipper 4-like [Pelobates cultripes]|uniref:Leucine zipper 4-like, partial n=1 Tax=Pelobates cultripes TaxID=61616 RepID=A0AAD1VJT4_PELCU|nr:leucine zipper 4-like [Pelobates cultripes]
MHRSEDNLHRSENNLHCSENNLHHSENNLHSSENNLHHSENNPHHCKNNPHHSENNPHHFENNLHHSENNLHRSENNLHHSENNLHSSENNLHHSENNLHSSENHLHNSENNLHHFENNLHHSENNLHRSENNSHHFENNLHHSENNLHHSENNLHHFENNLHHSENNPHRSKNNLHHFENNLHHSENNLHHSENNLHHSENNPHRSENNLHHSENNPHRSKNNLHHSENSLLPSKSMYCTLLIFSAAHPLRDPQLVNFQEMVVRSLMVVAVWICLSPLLCTASNEVRYVAINQSELLNIPVNGTDHVEWKTDDKVLNNRMKSYCGSIIKCQLYPNWSLLVTDVESFGERTYTYTTYTDLGKKKLHGEFKVIVIEKVKTPEISYECSTKKLQCVVPSGNVSSITITWNGQKKPSFNEHQTLIQVEISTKKAINVSCVAKGMLNQMEKTVWMDCTNFWTIYMILGATGGGIAFIIFLILLIYCIKLRCGKTHRRDAISLFITMYI